MIAPTREAFRELAKRGNLVPVCREVAADMETPVSAYLKITGGNHGDARPLSFLLESVEGGEKIARYSFLGINPRAVFIQKNGRAELIADGRAETVEGPDVFARVKRALSKYRPVEFPDLPPFTGGAVGYAAYDTLGEIEPTVPMPERSPLDAPEAFFMITDTILAFDRVKQVIKALSQAYLPPGADPDRVYDEAVAKVDALVALLRRPLTAIPTEVDPATREIEVVSNKTPEEFKAMVRAARKYIYDGDIIQAVLSQRFEAPLKVSPAAVYRASRMVNPSPYMFLLDYGDLAIVGASPEVHARCVGREITVRPIAGTRKRGANEAEDRALEAELLADPKERAEHIMLVDLARNDIGRIAAPGSVRVDQLMVVERYSHVIHIVSDVKGTLADGLGSDAVMRSTFPAGTLSGAPKVRAAQIISELEKERRGPYGGTVAYFSYNGNVDSCITIRTAALKNGKVYVQAGAGIVADSDPDMEYEETRNKARALMKALAMAEHFEPSLATNAR